MKNRWIASLLCLSVLFSLGGCKRELAVKPKEDSGGTGYGVTDKSVLTLQDLYVLRPGAKRSSVNELLGSSLSHAMEEADRDTYRLTDGETLVLTYNYNDQITAAELTDTAGKKQDFFAYLNDLGVISNYKTENDTPSAPEQQPDEQPDQLPPDVAPDTESEHVKPNEQKPSSSADGGYFSSKRYTYEMAAQILKPGEERETVVSAFGKPNSFSSVDFAKDGYLIDVYTMEDGSVLYLDYGYDRIKLRAVRKISGSTATDYLGSWGKEAKPEGYVRFTRNRSVFNTLKRNAKPSEIYRRFGAPDWLEGTSTHYRDAYMLLGGEIFYLDFGPNHAGLTAVVLQKEDGSVVNYTLK